MFPNKLVIATKMEKEDKILYFQYLLHKLLLWYKDLNKGDEEHNDITTLKALKLLFFVTAAKTSKIDNDTLLDKVFNSFVAMPFGHVETDVYDSIKNNKGDLEFFIITENKTIRKGQNNIQDLIGKLNKDFIKKIDESLNDLKELNNELILYKPFELVELSHEWYSWRKNYRIAKEQFRRSQPIPIDDIKEESKSFSILTF